MSGTEFLLDTNVLIGYFAGRSETHRLLTDNNVKLDAIAVSQITRIELLAHSALTADEDARIRSFLDGIRVISINKDVEEATIALRR